MPDLAAFYAASVVGVLREHLPDFDPEAAGIITQAVERNARDPQARFECIVDDPGRANWRLRARSIDRSCVRLACYRIPRCPVDGELVGAVNEALRARLDDSRMLPGKPRHACGRRKSAHSW
jgi:hypothetical protein